MTSDGGRALWSLQTIFILILFILGLPFTITTNGDPTLHEDNISWVISKELCATPHCSCSQHNISHTFLKCHCQEMKQIVNLERGKETSGHLSTTMTLHIENCSHVKIHPHAFALIDGPQLEVHLSNIPQLEIMEAAFELSPQIISRNLIFNNVTMKNIPSKSFPSSLNIIKFFNCDIGVIASLAFKGKTLQEVLFQESRVDLIKSKAFDEEILINNSWTVNRTMIGQVEDRAIESSITNMTWLDSEIGRLGSYSMSGIIPNGSFLRNIFRHVSSNGLTLRDWTRLTFLNNTFEVVEGNGIDLTQHSSQFNTTSLIGNTWKEIGIDFIKVGPTSSIPFTVVQENRILQQCNCSPLFIPQVTLNGSNVWFQEQIWNNSQCLTSSKGATCLGRSDSSDTSVSYSEWNLLCSESTFLCLNELELEVSEDVIYTPPLTGRLRILAIFIGTVGLAIVVALVGVLCVYMCRREKRRDEKNDVQQPKTLRLNGHSQSNHPIHVNNHAYTGILGNKVPIPESTKGSGGARPRSALFEDVEMEDKGVQTMPSELSTDVLEGLREKLTDPESFWDAKETIDHLYDLIHVREDSQSSPPDVTVLCPSNGHDNQRTKSTSTTNHRRPIKNPPPTRSTSLPQGQGQDAAVPLPRYAQIRAKPKTAPLCEYRDPSDSPLHIYSELNQQQNQPKVTSDDQPQPGEHRNLINDTHTLNPIMCDYTEPKDVQTHVYAELNSFPTHSPRPGLPFPQHNKTFCVQRPRPMGRLTTPPKVPVQDMRSMGTNQDSTSPPCQQRPLPSIPPPSSTSTLK